MKQKILQCIEWLLKPFHFGGLCVVFLLFVGFILPSVEENIEAFAGKNIEILDLQMGFSVKKGFEILEMYSPRGREIYLLAEISADIMYPLVYSFLLASILFFLVKKAKLTETKFKNLIFLPFMVQLFDYVENIFIVSTLIYFEQQPSTSLQIAALANALKWATMGLLILTLFILTILIFYKNKIKYK